VHSCARCGGSIGDAFRYCPWCAAPQRIKLVEFFRGHSRIESRGKALRVSRYLEHQPVERHVRFSIWSSSADRARAEAAVSLDEGEAARLGRFLLDTAPPEESRLVALRRIVEQLVAGRARG
jgi:hypothetical protein